jgi:AH receptor-interacting protein
MAINQRMDHKDLDELATNSCDLKFTIELLKVETPEEYEKEIWQMSGEEMLKKYLILKKREIFCTLRKFFRSWRLCTVGLNYYWTALIERKTWRWRMEPIGCDENTIALQFVSMQTNWRRLYAVIEHTNEDLKRDNRNVKALFRRAKANFSVWNLENARNDYKKCFAVNENKTK